MCHFQSLERYRDDMKEAPCVLKPSFSPFNAFFDPFLSLSSSISEVSRVGHKFPHESIWGKLREVEKEALV